MCSLKHVEKAMVLLCVRSQMLNNHWFFYVVAQTCWKTTNGFTSKEALKQQKQLFYCKTSFQLRIRGVMLQYSLDMLWGTLTAKLFRENKKAETIEKIIIGKHYNLMRKSYNNLIKSNEILIFLLYFPSFC